MPTHHQMVRTCLARYQQDPQLGQIAFDGRQQRRHAAQDRHVPLPEKVDEFAADETCPRLSGDKRSADNEGNPQFLD